MGLKEFDSGSGRWLNENGQIHKMSGSVSDEEIIVAYLKCYKAALKDGKEGAPNFTTHNASKLVKDLGHKVSLGAIRNKIAKARKDFEEHRGEGPYDYRNKTVGGKKVMTKTWFPTIKVEQVVSATKEERNAMIDKIVAEHF